MTNRNAGWAPGDPLYQTLGCDDRDQDFSFCAEGTDYAKNQVQSGYNLLAKGNGP